MRREMNIEACQFTLEQLRQAVAGGQGLSAEMRVKLATIGARIAESTKTTEILHTVPPGVNTKSLAAD